MRASRLALAFAGFLALFLVATLPLRLVLDGSSISARSVSGSVWSGTLSAATWRGLSVGDVSLGLAPLPLLTGTRRIDVGTATLTGSIESGRGGGAVRGFNGTASPGRIAGLPITGLSFTDFTAGFRDGRCDAASGSLTVTLGGPLADRGSFSGVPRCDGDRLLLPLQANAARLELRLADGGAFTAQVDLDAVEPAARPALLASGFQPTPTGFALTLQGTLQ